MFPLHYKTCPTTPKTPLRFWSLAFPKGMRLAGSQETNNHPMSLPRGPPQNGGVRWLAFQHPTTKQAPSKKNNAWHTQQRFFLLFFFWGGGDIDTPSWVPLLLGRVSLLAARPPRGSPVVFAWAFGLGAGPGPPAPAPGSPPAARSWRGRSRYARPPGAGSRGGETEKIYIYIYIFMFPSPVVPSPPPPNGMGPSRGRCGNHGRGVLCGHTVLPFSPPPFPQGGGGNHGPPPIPQGGGGLVGSHCATFSTEHDHWGGGGGGPRKPGTYRYNMVSPPPQDLPIYTNIWFVCLPSRGLSPKQSIGFVCHEYIYIYIYAYIYICIYIYIFIYSTWHCHTASGPGTQNRWTCCCSRRLRSGFPFGYGGSVGAYTIFCSMDWHTPWGRLSRNWRLFRACGRPGVAFRPSNCDSSPKEGIHNAI